MLHLPSDTHLIGCVNTTNQASPFIPQFSPLCLTGILIRSNLYNTCSIISQIVILISCDDGTVQTFIEQCKNYKKQLAIAIKEWRDEYEPKECKHP